MSLSNFDPMVYIDNFRKTEGTESKLLFGDPNLCPNPLLSIVIPTYRRAKLLEFALKSALHQTNSFCDYEVIVVDNEYLDIGVSETYNIIRKFEDPRVLYYQNEQNLGMAGNWNRCISLARGYWVAFLHDDDVLMPHYLSRIERLISRKDNIGGITVSFHVVFKDGEIDHIQESANRSAKQRLYSHLSSGRLMRMFPFDSNLLSYNTYLAPTCGSIFRKSFLMESGGFNDKHHPNFDWFFLYCFSKKHRLYRTMEKLGYYRMGLNETSQTKTKSAFIRGKIAFIGYASKNSITGKIMRYFFSNEQNRTVLYSNFSDYQGRKDSDYFRDSEIKKRRIRLFVYNGLGNLYWSMKTVYFLLFG